jgi:DUF1680 family protein
MMHKNLSHPVTIHDSFWNGRLEINSSRAIFHQWEQLEASGCIDNFRIAAGELDGFREGWFFADSDAYKWLDAAARIQAAWSDDALQSLMDGLIALLGRAQDPDGYLFTYNQVHFPGTRWVNLMIEHELYCHGHLIEAGVSHYESCGDLSLISIARKAADRVVEDFLGMGPAYTSGHEEIELALLRLYQATDHAPYLEMARHFLENRGTQSRVKFAILQIRQLKSVATRRSSVRQQRDQYIASHPGFNAKKLPPNNYSKSAPYSYVGWLLSDLNGNYLQQHAPIRHQTTPVGHSVRFGYLETAIAMLQRLDGDQSLGSAMETVWDRMVTRRMYVTGGIGSVPGLEGFGNDYELDPEYAYAETCAALACMFWSWELALLTREAKYSDLFEWQLYNAAGVGMGWSGTEYLYNNPLACHAGITRRSWYEVPCCPSNLSRTWADLGKYIYSSKVDSIWIHQYIGSKANLQPGVQVGVEMESELPWAGKVSLRVNPAKPTLLSMYFRIPSWVPNLGSFTSIFVNGHNVSDQASFIPPDIALLEKTAQGYDPRRSGFLSIGRTWSPGDTVELEFDLPITLQRTHPKVKAHHSKGAITRGPLVYCLESLDNQDIDIFSCRLDPASLVSETNLELFDGVTLLRGKTIDGQPLTFIPYFLWANRGESQMTVWVNL